MAVEVEAKPDEMVPVKLPARLKELLHKIAVHRGVSMGDLAKSLMGDRLHDAYEAMLRDELAATKARRKAAAAELAAAQSPDLGGES